MRLIDGNGLTGLYCIAARLKLECGAQPDRWVRVGSIRMWLVARPTVGARAKRREDLALVPLNP